MASAFALAMLLSADCGGSKDKKNPPPPHIVIEENESIQDVGERFVLDAGQTTDPNGPQDGLEFQWRIVSGGTDDTALDDHCRSDANVVCTTNDDDHCSTDETIFCHENDDCPSPGTCVINSGTSSPDCETGICGLGEGDEGVVATFRADVAGPFEVRLTAIGDESNATKTIELNTFPSLYLVGSLLQFGGTEGKLLGPVKDADEFVTEPVQGASDPANGNLVIIDDSLHLVRVFDLRTGAIVGAFGDSDRQVNDPAALTFHPVTNRLYIAETSGRVLVFDDTTQLLINKFGDVEDHPTALQFSPVGDDPDLLVVDGTPGVKIYDANGVAQGVLGETATATDEPVDLDFLDDGTLLIADRTGKVVRCDTDGTGCESFSPELDGMLANGSPTAIAVNPSAEFTDNDVLVTDPVGQRVIACKSNGNGCATFGETEDVDSEYRDIFFAPQETPTTASSTTTTTLN